MYTVTWLYNERRLNRCSLSLEAAMKLKWSLETRGIDAAITEE